MDAVHHGHGLAPGRATAPGQNKVQHAAAAGCEKPAHHQVTQAATKVGGAGGGAVAGAAQLASSTKAGGPTGDLAAVLQELVKVLTQLVEALKQMSQGASGGGGCMPATQVKGVWGEAAPALALPTAAPVSSTQASEDHSYEQRVLELVNTERARHGLGQLRYNSQLDAASERHNSVQVRTRTMAHIGIGDGDPGSRIRATGFGGAWGENVAVGQRSPEQVVREWMASPTHRANILNPAFRQLGVAYETTADGHAFWAQSFGS